jgi:hypothetical protein
MRRTTVTSTTLALLLSWSIAARADCLEDAKNFAIGLCGDLEKSGVRVTTSGNLQGNADLSNIIKKFIDISGKGEVAGTVDKYEGVAREELGKDRFDARTCRQNMAIRAMEVQCQKKVTFNTCSKAEFGFASWGASAEKTGSSGWRGSHHNEDEWCGELAAAALRENGAGPVHDWHIISKGEATRKQLGQPSYNYDCKVHIDYSPLYNTRTDPLCGIASVN